MSYNKISKKEYDAIHKKLPLIKKRNNELRKVRIKRNREFLKRIKSFPCTDCGNIYPPYVMDFDHQTDKKTDIATLVGRNVSIETIEKEIKKCELVCANCHRIRTHRRII